MENKIKIGIDLGGTKIELAAIDNNSNIIYRKRVQTPRFNYKQSIKVIFDLVTDAENELETFASVGLAVPGSISPFTGKMRNGNSTWLNGKDLLHDITLILKRDVKISNDANCFTISESIDGSALDAKTVFGVIMGTGIGGGLVINKTIIDGANGIAGEWGHNQMPWLNKAETKSRKCWCGSINCIETFISGPAIEKDFFEERNQKLKLEDIAKNDINEDLVSRKCINILINRTARCLASVINIYDPEIIVLGGGVSNIDRLYTEIPKLWNKWIFSDECITKLVKAKFGDSSGVRGAAWLHD